MGDPRKKEGICKFFNISALGAGLPCAGDADRASQDPPAASPIRADRRVRTSPGDPVIAMRRSPAGRMPAADEYSSREHHGIFAPPQRIETLVT
jgi:hypothetical protein